MPVPAPEISVDPVVPILPAPSAPQPASPKPVIPPDGTEPPTATEPEANSNPPESPRALTPLPKVYPRRERRPPDYYEPTL